MSSLRFNSKPEWNNMWGNRYFMGITNLLFNLYETLKNQPNLKMLEIGSYKGESTLLFGSLGIFKEIHCIDPFSGHEEANGIFNDSWDNVYTEFSTNIRHFDNIVLHRDYSYNIADKFPDKYFDFIYIDGNHEYKAVKQDILMYLPKTKNIIGGHDYGVTWPGVVQAVDEIFGKPHNIYADDSWAIAIN